MSLETDCPRQEVRPKTWADHIRVVVWLTPCPRDQAAGTGTQAAKSRDPTAKKNVYGISLPNRHKYVDKCKYRLRFTNLM